jgi:hypothetical protein
MYGSETQKINKGNEARLNCLETDYLEKPLWVVKSLESQK